MGVILQQLLYQGFGGICFEAPWILFFAWSLIYITWIFNVSALKIYSTICKIIYTGKLDACE